MAAFASLSGDEVKGSVEYRIARPDGSVCWINDRGFQVRDAAGALVSITGVATDITDRKQVMALTVQGAGPGCGATFILELPCNPDISSYENPAR